MSPEKLLNQAHSHQKEGRIGEAAIAFEKLSSLYPSYPPVLNDLGVAYLQLGRFKEGIKALQKSINLDPKQPMIFFNLGKAYQSLGNFDAAIDAYNQVTKIQPLFVDAYYNKGLCLNHLEIYSEAITCFDHGIEIHPKSPQLLNAKGISSYLSGNYSDAKITFQEALKLWQQSPEIHNNLGLALHKLNRFEEALESYKTALSFNSSYTDAYLNRGLTLQAMQKPLEALEAYNKCLLIDPNHSDANWNKALVKIFLGEYKEGWELYEWRWKSYSKKWAREYKAPLWTGNETIQNKSILIYPEQGFGDFIQFYRYIDNLQKLGAKIILEVPNPLINLISDQNGDVLIIKPGEKTPLFDFQCPIMSLPRAFKTCLDSIPNNLPYLAVNKEKLEEWKQKLGSKTKPRIGIAWSGAKGQANDHNRSTKLEKLLPLFELPFEFHSLQKEVRLEDESSLPLCSIQDHRHELKDFSDTAALIENMDLVISVDTSIAHLSGALNKKLFVLLAFNGDYRWLQNRNDSPWYPSAKILRQEEIGNWDSLIQKLIKEPDLLITLKS